MSIYRIAVHQTTHTCPGEPTPHVTAIHRRVLTVIDGGPCRAPVTVRCGDTTVTIACGRHEPTDRQCPACRTIITEHTITTSHHQPTPDEGDGRVAA